MKPPESVRRLLFGAALSLLALPSSPAPGDEASRLSLRVSGPALKNMVSRAAEIALRKLERRECLAVLAEFRDGDGRTLQKGLEARGASASGFFVQLTFIDGSAWSRCVDGSAAAGANPGGTIVAVCPRAFGRVLAKSPGLAADLLIHEMLHGLGLGENPPTSEEITSQVVERCGM
jgi:hypothetical protein